MISDEERRKFAENLRESREFISGLPKASLEQNAFGTFERILACVDYERGNIFDYLADLIEPCPIDGETSDGYHTFNELYHHRAVLFSVIVATFGERAWKSKLHADGTMYDGMFIVGIETPDGQATYHYDIDPYWNMFRCTELRRAPEWDGHTPNQAIERIGKLADLIDRSTCDVRMGVTGHVGVCMRCGAMVEMRAAVFDAIEALPTRYCPNCGAEVKNEVD